MKKKTKKQLTIDIVIILIFLIIAVFRYLNREEAASLVEGTVEMHIIDVGQGDSVLFKTEAGNILIDAGTGESETALSNYLDSVGVDSFEYCIFTHPHEDHIGGADMIMDNYEVRNVIMSPAVTTTNTFEKLLDALERSEANIIEAEPDMKYYVGDVEIMIMGPIVVGEERDLNNTSVITRITYGAVRMLFTGDAEAIQEQDILREYSIFDLDCDFLKMGHHGSSTSSSEDFINAVTPSIAAISCGKDNSYGHPHREIVALLNERNIEYHRTDELGDLVYVCNGKRLEYRD
ncbi:MAG: MBL fold metallo-hydrolase [Clostridia bacterium]|nr:MBL fold metallo-hydrolase [Clostridia bacterium]